MQFGPGSVDGYGASQVSQVGYGVANWYLVNGERERALELMREIVAGPSWAAFGRIASEADLARLESE